jgi:hypothetical protein
MGLVGPGRLIEATWPHGLGLVMDSEHEDRSGMEGGGSVMGQSLPGISPRVIGSGSKHLVYTIAEQKRSSSSS